MSGKPERVLILCTASDVGGMQRVVIDLARGLAGAGADVSSFAPRSAQAEDLRQWALREGVALELSEALADAAASHSWRGAWQLSRFVRDARADVVNIHYGDNFISLKDMVGLRLARRGRIVVSVHHPTDWEESGRKKRMMTELAARLADAIIVPSKATAAVLEQAGVSARKLTIVPNGVRQPDNPPSRATARAALGLPSDAFVVGTLARVTKHKGIDDLVRAVAELEDEETVLAIAGEGEERPALESLAAPLGERVRFLGRIPSAYDLYAASDIFALPSRLEGFGLVYVEAAMFGVPSVAADAGAVSEVVEDGATGLLVPPGDVGALRAAIVRLRDDAGLRRRLGQAARTRARERFSDTAMTAAYREVFAFGEGATRTAAPQTSGPPA